MGQMVVVCILYYSNANSTAVILDNEVISEQIA